MLSLHECGALPLEARSVKLAQRTHQTWTNPCPQKHLQLVCFDVRCKIVRTLQAGPSPNFTTNLHVHLSYSTKGREELHHVQAESMAPILTSQ